MLEQAQKYHDQSWNYLNNAYRELDSDLPQASEKAWGAASQMVKAVAEERGWPHSGHRLLYQHVDTLTEETDDGELRRLFAVASDLHVNFYEDIYSRRYIQAGIRDVERFLEKVSIFLPRSPESQD